MEINSNDIIGSNYNDIIDSSLKAPLHVQAICANLFAQIA